jgi:hypothetical protein
MTLKEDLSMIHDLQMKRTKAYDEENELDPSQIKTQIRDIISTNGLTKLGRGDYRIVYGNEEKVAKIAWHNLGIRENKSEIENWNRIKNFSVKKLNSQGECKAKNYLAEIMDYDINSYGWIIMERVQTGPNSVTTEEAERLRRIFSDSGINIDEIKPYNIGRKYRDEFGKNIPVVFDYGGK